MKQKCNCLDVKKKKKNVLHLCSELQKLTWIYQQKNCAREVMKFAELKSEEYDFFFYVVFVNMKLRHIILREFSSYSNYPFLFYFVSLKNNSFFAIKYFAFQAISWLMVPPL